MTLHEVFLVVMMVGGLAGVRFSLRHTSLTDVPLVALAMSSRWDYLLCGLLFGAGLPLCVSGLLTEMVMSSLVLFATWYGFVIGCRIDRRNGKPLRQFWFLELLQITLTLAALLLLTTLAAWSEVGTGSLNTKLVIMGICAVTVSQKSGKSRLMVDSRDSGGSSWGALLAVLLVGWGINDWREASFYIDLSLADNNRGIVIEGSAERLFSTLALGCLTGLLGDLLVRDVTPGWIAFGLVTLLLAMSGLAAHLGLEPLWLGLVAGMWLTRATLRRRDVMRCVSTVHDYGQTATYLLGGWLLGYGLRIGWMETKAFLVALCAFLLVRTMARLVALRMVARLAIRQWLGKVAVSASSYVEIDDLALALALAFMTVRPDGTGIALLAAVVITQVALRCLFKVRTEMGR